MKRPYVKSDDESDQDCSQESAGSDSEDREPPLIQASSKRKGKGKAKVPASPKLSQRASVLSLATDGNSTVNLDDVDEGILSRIKKALALANHAGTGEAETKKALKVAQIWMQRINVTQAQVMAHESAEEQSKRGGMSVCVVNGTGKTLTNKRWVDLLCSAMCEYFDCKSYHTSYRKEPRIDYVFYGLAGSTVSAAQAFEVCHNLIMTWAAQRLKARDITGKVGTNSYKEGASRGLLQHATQTKKEELQLVEAAEKRRLANAVKTEQKEDMARDQRREGPRVKEEPTEPSNSPLITVKREPEDNTAGDLPSSTKVKVEEIEDERDVKPTQPLADPNSIGSFRVKVEDTEDEQDVKAARPTAAASSSNKVKVEEEDPVVEFNRDVSDPASPFGQRGSSDSPSRDVQDDEADVDMLDQGEGNNSDSDEAEVFGDDDNPENTLQLNGDDEEGHVPPSRDSSVQNEPEQNVRERNSNSEHPIPKEEEPLWHSAGALIQFRSQAANIADDFLKSAGTKLKKGKKRPPNKRDYTAYRRGQEDSKKIDVKQRRLE